MCVCGSLPLYHSTCLSVYLSRLWRSDSKEQPDNVRNIIKLTMIMPPSYDCMAGCCRRERERDRQDTLRIQLVIWVTVHPLPRAPPLLMLIAVTVSISFSISDCVPVTWDGSENSNVWVHLAHGNREARETGGGGFTLGTWGHWWTDKRAHWSTLRSAWHSRSPN